MTDHRASLRDLFSAVRPLGMTLVKSERTRRRPGEIVVATSGGLDADRLATAIGARRGNATSHDLLLAVAHVDDDLLGLAAEVGTHRRIGGDALIVVSASAVERRIIERELRTDPDVSVAVMMMVDDISGAELSRIIDRIADICAGRNDGMRTRYPALRSQVADRLAQRAARDVAIVSALSKERSGALSVRQTRLAADVAGLRGETFDPKTLGLVAVIGLVSPLLRRTVGRLTGLVPFVQIVVRAATAYSVTRLVGIAAQRAAMDGRARSREER
jgi:hypothetical protein